MLFLESFLRLIIIIRLGVEDLQAGAFSRGRRFAN